jgi:hypothetical protein
MNNCSDKLVQPQHLYNIALWLWVLRGFKNCVTMLFCFNDRSVFTCLLLSICDFISVFPLWPIPNYRLHHLHCVVRVLLSTTRVNLYPRTFELAQKFGFFRRHSIWLWLWITFRSFSFRINTLSPLRVTVIKSSWVRLTHDNCIRYIYIICPPYC